VLTPVDVKEPTKVITVRLPRTIHLQLKWLAHTRQQSLNQMVIEMVTTPLAEALRKGPGAAILVPPKG
jgi:predicted HicB family RNase H-like nuclease